MFQKFSFVSTVQKQFDSTVESIISTGKNDSDLPKSTAKPIDLTDERLASTSDLHFDSMAASLSFLSPQRTKNNITRRSNYLPQ